MSHQTFKGEMKMNYEFSEVENLLLNMSAGLLPENLSENEVNLLIDEYGANWFEVLGYNTQEYKKPKFEPSF